MLTKRDPKSKQALIEYLQQDTDERLWQAISNFAKLHGLSQHFLLTSDELDGHSNCKDLFFQESDNIFSE